MPKSAMETVTFGAGCFWGVELAFQRIPGVLSTQVGYCQGSSEQTTYEVTSHAARHASSSHR